MALPLPPPPPGIRDLQRLAEGGSSVVYVGHHAALGERVAVKYLKAELASDREVRARFLREARLSASLEHPNLPRVHGSGEVEGRPYLVLEYVDGRPLGELLKERKRIPEGQVRSVARQTLAGLAAAHRLEILHRDIKPSNLVVSSAGRLKLVDFGVARRRNGLAITRRGEAMGTPAFMSPEQCAGEDLDGRSDLYGLGACLFYLLTGRPPFRGETPSKTLEMHLFEPVPDLSRLVPGISPAFQIVVERLLAKEPAQRYPDAEQAREAIVPGDSLRALFSPSGGRGREPDPA